MLTISILSTVNELPPVFASTDLIAICFTPDLVAESIPCGNVPHFEAHFIFDCNSYS